MTRFLPNPTPCGRTRREFLWQVGGGFAGLALIDLLPDAERSPRRPPSARSRAQAAALPGEGEALRVPVHERRAEPGRHVRSQAGADQATTAQPYTGDAQGRLERPADRPPDAVAVRVHAARPERPARSAACFRTRRASPTTCA